MYNKELCLYTIEQPYTLMYTTASQASYIIEEAPGVDFSGNETLRNAYTRAYPKTGATPTKIKGMRGNADLLKILFRALAGRYNPN